MSDGANNVVALRAPARVDAPADLTNPVYQLTVVRRLSREWRAVMSDREYVVLTFIIDHTVCWGRPSYRFTYRCFNEGTPVSVGLRKSKPQVTEALRSLEAAGAISIDPNKRDGLTITPNTEWRPMLPTPKRLSGGNRGQENRPPEGRKPYRQGEGNPTPLLEDHPEDQARGAIPAASATGLPGTSENHSIPETKPISVPTPSVRLRTRPARTENPAPPAKPEHEVTEQGELRLGDVTLVSADSSIPASRKNHAAQAKLVARRHTRNGKALFETWSDAWTEAYRDVRGAGCVPWTKVEMAMVVTQLAKPFQGTSPEMHDFVDWMVLNWSSIIVDHFGWMKREPPPSQPTIRFVIAFKDKFWTAYSRRSVDRYLNSLSGEDRAYREDLMKRGMSHDQAAAEIAKRQAAAEIREKVEAERAAAARDRRVASTERASLAVERRVLESRMAEAMRRGGQAQPSKTVLPDGAREVSDEELAESVQLVAKMMEVDPDGE